MLTLPASQTFDVSSVQEDLNTGQRVQSYAVDAWNGNLQIWACDGGTNQQWTLTSSNLLTVYGNKCLDLPGRARRPPDGGDVVHLALGPGQASDDESGGPSVGARHGLRDESSPSVRRPHVRAMGHLDAR